MKTEKDIEIVPKFVRYRFTESERKTIADDMAQAVETKEEAEDQLKAIKADYKSSIEEAEAKIRACARKLQIGYEMRNVDCTVDRDFKQRVIRFIRCDTFETVEERPMTSDELQMKLV